MDGSRAARVVLPLVVAAVLLVGCQAAAGDTGRAAVSPSSPYRTVKVTDNKWTDSTNASALRLGDKRLSTTPKAGYLDSCQTTFGGGGGATSSGSWLDAGAGTWNSTTKPSVQGSVSWPAASFSVTDSGSSRIVKTNDLPKGQTTGTFPIASSDPVHVYDQNPNSITAQSFTYRLPRDPKAAAKPSCTSLGPVGVLDDGVVLLNALDGEGRDAAAHEILDHCDGHPMMAGAYHYHLVSRCFMPTTASSATLVGYALDGYGIYVERNAAGKLPTDSDLDACHGRTSKVLFGGTMVVMYHYDATLAFPYTIGCYHGTPITTAH